MESSMTAAAMPMLVANALRNRSLESASPNHLKVGPPQVSNVLLALKASLNTTTIGRKRNANTMADMAAENQC